MGKNTLSNSRTRAASSKKQVALTGNDWASTLDEEERRPVSQQGRAFCPVMERQKRHLRFDSRR